MNVVNDDYEDARAAAADLPTPVVELWERRAVRRLHRGAPPWPEVARVMGVRSVLRERSR